MNERCLTWWSIGGPTGLCAVAAVVLCGCQQQMADQPSFKPLVPSEFFPDGRSARPVIAGTVARGNLRIDTAFFTGRIVGGRTENAAGNAANVATTTASPSVAPASAPTTIGTDVVPPAFRDDAAFVREFPVAVSESLVEYGYNRYMIYCVVCHDPLGTGRGKIIERGYTPPPSLHIERLRNAPDGRIFAVITEGYGSMPSYASQIPPADRWAIVAYVRALQLSQRFAKDDLTPEMRQEFVRGVASSSKDFNSTDEPKDKAH
jgi:mono/diheme cytochrome c family protein